MKNDKLKKWEMALVLSLCITLCHGFAVNAAGVNWWGVIFPGLARTEPVESVETAKLDGLNAGGIEIRFQFLDWLGSIFR